jgi:hypothetical protein
VSFRKKYHICGTQYALPGGFIMCCPLLILILVSHAGKQAPWAQGYDF